MLQRAHAGIKKEGWERSDVHFCCSLRDDIYLTHIDLPSPLHMHVIPTLIASCCAPKQPEEGFRKHCAILALKYVFRSYATKALTELIISPGLDKHSTLGWRSFLFFFFFLAALRQRASCRYLNSTDPRQGRQPREMAPTYQSRSEQQISKEKAREGERPRYKHTQRQLITMDGSPRAPRAHFLPGLRQYEHGALSKVGARRVLTILNCQRLSCLTCGA